MLQAIRHDDTLASTDAGLPSTAPCNSRHKPVPFTWESAW